MLALLDWLVRALAFFNTIALVWLGLTVLLNAERRTWGALLGGGGLLAGGLMMAAAATLIGRETSASLTELEWWWRLLWVPFVGAPYLWYAVIAWYTGHQSGSRHRVALVVSGAFGIVTFGTLVAVRPLAGYAAEASSTSLYNALVPVLLYVLYGGLCVALSLAALRHPVSAERFMGDLARTRARPWLVVAALVLLALSLSVAATAFWLLALPASRVGSVRALSVLLGFAVLALGLIAVTTVLVGRAVVTYEIFTGKTLPRGGLFRQWRSSLVLAAGYGLLLGGSLGLPIDAIHRLVLATLLMTVFAALVSWRSYVERQRSMDRLRPFVASQRLYERLLRLAAEPGVDASAPFAALCDDVLGARRAYLVALGPLAPLVGPPLVQPPGAGRPPDTSDLATQLGSPDVLALPIEPSRYAGAGWAVPLWSERGLIGVLLLGDKRDGGVYTQEEIEIARATGERLIDTQASAEMARRLMVIQRERLAESQILDRRARRLLHDEVLPRLHTALLQLSGDGGKSEAVDTIADAHREIANLLREAPPVVSPEVARLGLVDALQQAIEGELSASFDGIRWQVDPKAEQAASSLSALSAEVLFGASREAIRNAARHGRDGDPSRALHLDVSVDWQDGLVIAIEDDGVGPAAAGASAEGSGQGLAIHGTMMAVIGGTLTAERTRDASTRVVLALPLTADAASSGLTSLPR